MGRSFIAINQTSGIFVLGGFMINRRRQRLRVVLRMGSVFIAISRRPRNHDGPRIGLIDDFFGNVFSKTKGFPWIWPDKTPTQEVVSPRLSGMPNFCTR